MSEDDNKDKNRNKNNEELLVISGLRNEKE